MYVELRISVELNHVQGKFASREELVDALIEEVQDPSEVEGSEGGIYVVDQWDVEDDTPGPPRSEKEIIGRLSQAVFVLTGKNDDRTVKNFLAAAKAAGVSIS